MVNKVNKILLLIDLIYILNMKLVLVFIKIKYGVNKFVKNLMNLGIEFEFIYGSKL